MSHSHAPSDTPARISKPAFRILVIGMSAMFVLTIGALAVLWPKAQELPAERPYLAESAQLITGKVVEVHPADESDMMGSVEVLLDDGKIVTVATNPSVPAADMSPGDKLRIMQLEVLGAPMHVLMDYHRGTPMLILAGIFVIVVIAVARWKGLAALLGLLGAVITVWLFTLPALLAGRNPLLVALVTASAVMFIVVYLAHGVSVKSTTALLGTFAGIALVSTLAWWAIPTTHLTPGIHEEMAILASIAPHTSLRGVLLCGMVLAGVGILNDVTITQASAVWELRETAPTLSRSAIFAAALRIGRDHIASTVYTIAFAYVGGALALLMLASTIDYRITQLITMEDIAEELVSTMVASIGLVLTIPLTTAIGVWMCGGAQHHDSADVFSAAPAIA
ncbi:MAG: YibE/F family protein [Propionibacteriaceae bacterium]|jgi:uncharacterized membrane protein|nr:YibE/F family protein [Propionibacteriaceae bacterium]